MDKYHEKCHKCGKACGVHGLSTYFDIDDDSKMRLCYICGLDMFSRQVWALRRERRELRRTIEELKQGVKS